MNKRRAGNTTLSKVIAGLFGLLVILAALGTLGQLLGGLVFGTIEKLPKSAIGVLTLYRYWPVYGHDPRVHKALAISSAIAGAVTVIPVVAIIAFVTLAVMKRRELHGSARFANLREIRKTGLVEDDQS